VRDALPAPLVAGLRRLSRLRWLTKARVLRFYGVRFTEHPLVAARYVALDPELDNFSYDLDNEGELADVLATALGVSAASITALFAELHGDRRLAAELAARARWRPDAKTRMGFGRRVAWYAAARVLRPTLTVEAGIKDGLGSTAILAALERNADEGHPGRLLSFDLSPDRGWLVPERLRTRWEPVFRSTWDALEPALTDGQVGLLVHDSEPTYECERFEVETALGHAAPRLVVFSNSDWSTALRDACERRGAPYNQFRERPRHLFYPGAGVGVGVFGPG
jgi:methyltransferase family protein